MKPKLSIVVGWVLLVLNAVVVGTPSAMCIAEVSRGGKIDDPHLFAGLLCFGAAWLLLLVVWLAAGHLNRPRARTSWYCLVLSLLVMVIVLGDPRRSQQ
jgi:hypothetical protein